MNLLISGLGPFRLRQRRVASSGGRLFAPIRPLRLFAVKADLAWPPRCVGEPTDNRRHYIRMPRYHFHIVDGLEVFDSVGATLPSDEAARVHAVKLARGFSRPQLERLRAKAVRVTSETGAVLFRVPIRRDDRRRA